ncbi:MAG: substrate-binding domain-containing protein [Trueperaceae bacterium]|nr:substrate-binding domain-containing protein [Trueperaceae bacterium]
MQRSLNWYRPLALLLALALALGSLAFAQRLPLNPLPDEPERNFWYFLEVQEDEVLAALQAVVAAPAVPISVTLDAPIKIAVIYPSQDVSDIWLRSFIAMSARLDELQIPYEAVQFASGMGDHDLQTTYTDLVLEEGYDYVIYGPTELSIQQDNIKRIIDAPGVEVITWNNDLVIKEWGDEQVLLYGGYAHLDGARRMAEYVVERWGNEGNFALVRGTPGLIDDQRSQGFRDHLEAISNWTFLYEHYGMFQREGGFDGAQFIATAYPEVDLIHNANTAMAMGAVSAIDSLGLIDDIALTGWGGTGDEVEAIRMSELKATPMRINDDMGAASAEAIKYHLEGRANELPLVFLMRIEILTNLLDEAEIVALEQEAFRYSGVGTLER